MADGVFHGPLAASSLGDVSRVDGEYVVRPGKFFECGQYPDKEFSLTESEADAGLVGFEPCKLTSQHAPSWFDRFGLGKILNLYRQGKEIMGDFSIWRPLHEKAKELGEPLTISAEWDRKTKRPIGGSIVLAPRVADAAIMAAFSLGPALVTRVLAETGGVAMQGYAEGRQFGQKLNGERVTFASAEGRYDTMTGQSALQELHDTAVRRGAVCSAANRVQMASQHENAAVQQIHDLTASHGAVCESRGFGPSYFSGGSSGTDAARIAREGFEEGRAYAERFNRGGVK